ncbi:MAG: CYTH domain-containing protein [Bacteroidales bacterium]|nr:CYTH domain-containing protein [Bacteroidales bacterium]
MGKEIERKYLVKGDQFKKLAKGVFCRQGYLCFENKNAFRVRIIGENAFLTIKGKTGGVTRLEYEYKIPFDEAKEIIEKLCVKQIEKFRYNYEYKGFLWEVDEFLGKNEGLVIAEIELESEDQFFKKPSWIGEEVSYDIKFQNYQLAINPYKNWK